MEASQLLKGILEGCVLGVISQGETYGYEILQALEDFGFDNVGEGTLYPILTRLDKNGYITCRRGKSPMGPVRKYYSISEEGAAYYAAFQENYKRITKCADAVLFPKYSEKTPGI